MANLYSNENVAHGIVDSLRGLGHDVETSVEARTANQWIPDDQVLAYGFANQRIVLTGNRRDFIKLDRDGADHAGLIVFTFDPDSNALANRIHSALTDPIRPTGRFLASVTKAGHRFWVR